MTAATPAIDWDAVEEETVRLLCEFIAIDTSNPPGNEEAACRWLAGILQREGISSTYYESAPGRGSLIARLRGSGSRGPLMLLNHTDVVPAQPEYWSVPAFAGVIKDGCVWGRGAQDMKGLGILELMTFLLIKRLELPLGRDLILFAIADEEAGGEYGVEWFAREHPDLLACDTIVISDSPMYAEGQPAITTGLKGAAFAEITVRTGKHDLHSGLYGGAAPNAIQALCAIVARLKDDQGRIKRQVARFRLYGLDAADAVVQELTAADADITWTVHLANKKAAWYQFKQLMGSVSSVRLYVAMLLAKDEPFGEQLGLSLYFSSATWLVHEESHAMLA